MSGHKGGGSPAIPKTEIYTFTRDFILRVRSKSFCLWFLPAQRRPGRIPVWRRGDLSGPRRHVERPAVAHGANLGDRIHLGDGQLESPEYGRDDPAPGAARRADGPEPAALHRAPGSACAGRAPSRPLSSTTTTTLRRATAPSVGMKYPKVYPKRIWDILWEKETRYNHPIRPARQSDIFGKEDPCVPLPT